MNLKDLHKEVYKTVHGITVVSEDEHYFFHVDENGKRLYEENYLDATNFKEDGTALVMKCFDDKIRTRAEELAEMIAMGHVTPEELTEEDYYEEDTRRYLWARIDRNGNVISEWRDRSHYNLW